ncbi:hypothetical protein KIN20_013669 [Parelaphostrongylus tenuis]|uniref:DZANK-type domain-containing protein n=1 Tax=Parelaphostrongylus tenuis TaxID=148309 RepID=A0AAD5MFY2_PARTN|nr:hypothetical protein KIN20_013669 [Parelaphostrongylus tenuis]
MPGNVSSGADSNIYALCPACNALPENNMDKFCRQCGYQFTIACRNCREKIRPYDRFCPSCGAHRLVIFDQIKRYLHVHSSQAALALAIILGTAWLALRYALRNKLR